MAEAFADYLGRHRRPLATLDPEAWDDDLGWLDGVIGDARAVGIGELAHGVHECYLIRHRLVRYLVEKLGFTVYGMESAFSEGIKVERWLAGGPGDVRDVAQTGMTYNMGSCLEFEAQLEWMRKARLRYVGLDIPGSALTYAAAVDALQSYLEAVDPASESLLDAPRRVCEPLRGKGVVAAYKTFADLDETAKDASTAALGALDVRFAAGETEYVRAGGGEALDVARQHLRLARSLDLQLRRGWVAGEQGGILPNYRDAAMAGTVSWVLDSNPAAKIVFGAHNAHLQRTPLDGLAPGRSLRMLGAYLDERLGAGYLCIATTAGAGQTRSYTPDPNSPSGFVTGELELETRPDSLDAALDRAGGLSVVDLRPARGRVDEVLTARINERFTEGLDAVNAYDVAVHLPTVRLCDSPRRPEEAVAS